MREFKITDARDGQSRTIRHFQIQDFFDENVDQITEEKVSLIIDFISVIQQTREQFGIQRNPVIVQSEDGSKRVCLFSIITHALERARFEGVVDIPEQVRLCKIMRPGCVMTFDEYKYIYKVMMVFISCYKNSWQSLEEVNNLDRDFAGFTTGETSDRNNTVSGDTNRTNLTVSGGVSGDGRSGGQMGVGQYGQFGQNVMGQGMAAQNLGQDSNQNRLQNEEFNLERVNTTVNNFSQFDNRLSSDVYDVPVPSAYS